MWIVVSLARDHDSIRSTKKYKTYESCELKSICQTAQTSSCNNFSVGLLLHLAVQKKSLNEWFDHLVHHPILMSGQKKFKTGLKFSINISNQDIQQEYKFSGKNEFSCKNISFPVRRWATHHPQWSHHLTPTQHTHPIPPTKHNTLCPVTHLHHHSHHPPPFWIQTVQSTTTPVKWKDPKSKSPILPLFPHYPKFDILLLLSQGLRFPISLNLNKTSSQQSNKISLWSLVPYSFKLATAKKGKGATMHTYIWNAKSCDWPNDQILFVYEKRCNDLSIDDADEGEMRNIEKEKSGTCFTNPGAFSSSICRFKRMGVVCDWGIWCLCWVGGRWWLYCGWWVANLHERENSYSLLSFVLFENFFNAS